MFIICTVYLTMARLLFLLCSALLLTGHVNTNTDGFYTIPEPDIVAFEDGGLRIIVKDDTGISLIRFHGNINQEMKQLYPGTINIETSTKINGKWVLEDRHVRLHVDDVIFYWLFVEKTRLGYVKQPLQFRVNELIPYYDEDKTTTTRTWRTTTFTTEATPKTSSACPSVVPNDIPLAFLQDQINTLNRKLDLLTSITSLQGQVDTLTKKFDAITTSSVLQYEVKNMSKAIEFIMVILENLPEIKRLTLSGVIPPDLNSSPISVVRLVIWEKLDLRVDIVTAVRNSEGAIIFELKTLQEKFDVLNAAKEKLKDTRIIIS